MKSTPFGSANFHLNSTLSGSINTALTLTRMINASETVNGHTANFSATNSFTLTAAQIAAAIVAQRIGHRERAVLRRNVMASAYSGSGFPASAYPSMMSYSAAGYGGGGYSYGGGGMAYGGGAAPAEQQGVAPGVQVAGNGENRPTPDEQAVNRLLAAAGVSDVAGNLLWPVGLRALPADRDGRLRGRIDALLAQEKDEAASGTVTADLQRDLTSAVDALRKQLLRDREERFSLTHRAYEDAEDYLAKLKQVSKQLVKAGEAATRELRSGKSGGTAPPKAGKKEEK